jgi:hypothetical protein
LCHLRVQPDFQSNFGPIRECGRTAHFCKRHQVRRLCDLRRLLRRQTRYPLSYGRADDTDSNSIIASWSIILKAWTLYREGRSSFQTMLPAKGETLYHQQLSRPLQLLQLRLSLHSVQLGPFRKEFRSQSNPPVLNLVEISRPLSDYIRSRLSPRHAHSNQIHLPRPFLTMPSRESLKLPEQQSAFVHGGTQVLTQRRAAAVIP